MTAALLFPGQGSQSVGMGRELADAFADARAVFDEVDDALGEPLSQMIWNGPAADLTLTRNAQPALMAVSLAAVAALEAAGLRLPGKTAFAAGHSLGEYSALAAAGAFTIADAARLLRRRGDAMQSAVPVGEGAMAALLGLDLATAEAVAAEAAGGEVCAVANDNSDGQVVVSGHTAAVNRAIEIARAKGAKRAILLPVSAPFHCSLMAPAAVAMARVLGDIAISVPRLPIVANVTAAPVLDPDEIRRLLVEQVTGRVRWRETILRLAAEGVDTFVEVGAGRVLTGLVKRSVDGARCLAVGTPDDIPAALEALSG